MRTPRNCLLETHANINTHWPQFSLDGFLRRYHHPESGGQKGRRSSADLRLQADTLRIFGSNCKFELDDFESEWLYTHDFDFIHGVSTSHAALTWTRDDELTSAANAQSCV